MLWLCTQSWFYPQNFDLKQVYPVLGLENWGRIDEPFYSGSLLQNVSTEAHFKEKLPKIVYFSAVHSSGQNLGHYTHKLSTPWILLQKCKSWYLVENTY